MLADKAHISINKTVFIHNHASKNIRFITKIDNGLTFFGNDYPNLLIN